MLGLKNVNRPRLLIYSPFLSLCEMGGTFKDIPAINFDVGIFKI